MITGASTGIGSAVAQGFAAHGAKVVVNYNASAEQAGAVAKLIADAGGEVLLHQADVTDTAALSGSVDATGRNWPHRCAREQCRCYARPCPDGRDG